ncbi:uncharacterized protein LOC110849952 [Folsomia candida]|uniref:Uncharacterized protein n=1 Tax=Folsomia candida TaxID=158441 RepID=A0A226E785_FOLCA|nr:uncharacterized protein LOC110849952 [Folsomia candida]OXA53463.1 hypothetical protein Fcan01_10676 [Folsomia candida]
MKFTHVFTIAVAVIFAFTVIPSTEAFNCYNCVYLQGNNASTSQCENKPKDLTPIYCGSRSAEGPMTATLIPGYTQNSVRSPKNLCGKGTGSYNSKKVVLRACVPYAESSHDGKCNKYYDWRITFQNGSYIDFRGNGTNALNTCLCSKDKCNGANGLHSGVTVAVLGTFLTLLRKLY